MTSVDAGRLAERLAGLLGVSRLGHARRCGGEAGALVAVEGIDGAGSTTVSHLLVQVLGALGLRTIYTKEPTGSPIGALIRRMLRGREEGAEPEVLAHLFTADRLHHLYLQVVAPGARGVVGAAAGGYIVVLDRYKYSTAAYQSADTHPQSTYTIRDLLSLNDAAPPPHILVYLDVEPETAIARIEARGTPREAMENVETLRRARRAYHRLLALLEEEPEWPTRREPRWARKLRAAGVEPHCLYQPGLPAPTVIRIDANKPLERVALEAAKAVAEALLEQGIVRREA